MLAAIPIIGSVVTAVGTWFTNRQKLKQAEVDGKIAVTQAVTNANINRASTGQTADIKWEQTALATAGWKDEFWTVVLALPMILCFIPGLTQVVADGFVALRDNTPEWYQWAVLVAISASFGYRKLADFMAKKKGL